MISISKSLSTRVGIAVIVVEIVALTLMGSLYVRRFSQELDKQYVAKLQIPGVLMSRGLLHYASAADKKTMERLVEAELADCFIVGVNRNIFYSIRPTYMEKSIDEVLAPEDVRFIDDSQAQGGIRQVDADEGRYIVSVVPLRFEDGKRIGSLVLKAHMTKLGSEKRSIVLLFVVGSISCVTVNSILIMIVLYYIVLGRVLGLQRVVSRLEAGNLDKRIGGRRSSDEIGSLENGINAMASQLQETIGRLEQRVHELKRAEGALQQANDELEARVGLRTIELSDANEQLKREIGERARAAAALQEQLELNRKLMDTIPNPVYWKRVTGEYNNCNIALEKFTGLAREQIIEKHAGDLWPEDVVRQETSMDAALIEHPGVQTYETSIPASDGVCHAMILTRSTYYNADGSVIGIVGAMIDITERKRAEAEREDLNRKLLVASRQAGMAEVATNVLHNVGNVLNSVNVAASLVHDRVVSSRASSLGQAVDVLRAHEHDLARFFSAEERGRQLPVYLGKLAEHLADERSANVQNLKALIKSIEHIRNIINLQQRYAGSASIVETTVLADLIEDALRINVFNAERDVIGIVRRYEAVPPIMTDKHKVLQILVNLVGNAKKALAEVPEGNKKLVLCIDMHDESSVRIQVKDNGVGIAVENRNRIFQHGFTTRKDGHGFGLHSGSLAAKELGGSLDVHSDGVGKGATFSLVLPVQGVAKPRS